MTLRYVGDEEMWDDDEWKDSSNAPKYAILLKAFDACGRTAHRFRSETEYNKWIKAAKKTDGWLENCIGWAVSKNEDRRTVAIQFPQLLSAMNNVARYNDWQGKQPATTVKEQRPDSASYEGPTTASNE